MSESKWIMFQSDHRTKSKLTEVWTIITKEGNFVLGEVKWFGRWRGYAFFPQQETVFEKQCLRDIASFVENKNTEHRQKRLARKAAVEEVQ